MNSMVHDSRILRFDRFNVERSVYPPGLYMAPHRDKLSRISVVLEGELWEHTHDDAVKATGNYVVIKPNHVVHENTFGNKPCHLLSVSFNDDALLTSRLQSWEWISHPAMNVLAVRLWTQVQRVKDEQTLMHYFEEFFTMLASLREPLASTTVDWPAAVKQLLEADLTEPRAIQDLSQQFSLHRVSLTRGFKKQYALSPVQFRKYTRVMMALQQLALTRKSLAAIAYDAGFADQPHLSREVKSLTGCTPAAFRKLMEMV